MPYEYVYMHVSICSIQAGVFWEEAYMHRKAASVTAEKVAMASKLSVWFCGLKEIIQAKRQT